MGRGREGEKEGWADGWLDSWMDEQRNRRAEKEGWGNNGDGTGRQTIEQIQTEDKGGIDREKVEEIR